MLLWTIRGLFILVWAGIAASLASMFSTILNPYVGFAAVILMGGTAIALDVFFQRTKIAVVSAIFFGLIVGLILSSLLRVALVPFVEFVENSLPAKMLADVGAA